MISQQQEGESKSTPYFDATFQILGRLDSGEYSDVWKARDNQNDVSAIKKLKVSFMSWDHRWEQITEVEHLLKLQHSKHCVQLLNAWEQEGYLYLQMELCTRGSLERYIQLHHRKISHDIIWDMMYEIALGVKDIHEQDLVHLDLKPSNLLIDNNGFIKIADFGVSVQVPADHKWVRGEGDRRYMAPDLLREQFDKPADIFSLGMILLELATGIVLPDEGESWENLRLGDFSEMESSLLLVPEEMSNMIKWLLTAESASRPNIDAVLESDAFANRQVSDKGILYQYVLQQSQETTSILFEQEEDGNKCIGSQTIYSTPEARVY
ncbi:kinase-like protein [Backusella circina FSU 941]|nr:kinase-like protein [Backusella circina FSU 941]